RACPCPGPSRVADHDRSGALENRLDAVENPFCEPLEFRAAMVDDCPIHRAQDAIGDRRRSGNLQKMPAGNAGRVLSHEVFPGVTCWKSLRIRRQEAAATALGCSFGPSRT